MSWEQYVDEISLLLVLNAVGHLLFGRIATTKKMRENIAAIRLHKIFCFYLSSR